MVATNNTTFNNNMLSPVGFTFKVRKLPVFEHFVQSFKFPDVDMDMNSGQATPFVRIPIPGNQLSFGPLVVNFKIDEFMSNYIEVYEWMHGLGLFDSNEPYEDLSSKPLGYGIEVDGSLTVLDSAMSPSISFHFHDLF